MLEILSHSSHFFPLYFMKFWKKVPKETEFKEQNVVGNPESITIFFRTSHHVFI